MQVGDNRVPRNLLYKVICCREQFLSSYVNYIQIYTKEIIKIGHRIHAFIFGDSLAIYLKLK